jgi:pyrroline-5-carboxylate reductase
MMIEALADGGVLAGLPRDIALQLAAQTTFGASKLLLESAGKHPAALRDSVTSPGGTTAAGLLQLENAAVRAAFTKAVQAAANRSIELGQASAKAKL